MITDSFDNETKAIIGPTVNPDAVEVDCCIMTFSYIIENAVLASYDCTRIGTIWSAAGETPVYHIGYKGKRIAFYRTFIGAASCTAITEDTLSVVKSKGYILFGGAGCLNKEIARGKVMVPTEAYRDEGTSYHYAPAADYIMIKNSAVVSDFMREYKIPYVLGKTWTTDAIYRETVGGFEKRKAEGCISVEMECAALQAMCDFRGLELYAFFTGGDLLDAPEWDLRLKDGQIKGTQHDAGHFNIALELAYYVASLSER